jgi:hypothetical protein
MTDADLIKKINRIQSVAGALQMIAGQRMFVGNDPYYRDINDALWCMIDRVLEKSK